MNRKVCERTSWVLLLAGLPACVSFDALVARDAGKSDEGFEVDASAEPELEPDAGIDVPPNADTGEEIDAGVEPCTSNAECAADEVCSLESRCMPRCLANDDACVVVQASRPIDQLLSDDAALYWLVQASRDPLGNPRADGELWRMRAGREAERITHGLPGHPMFVVQGEYAYFVPWDRGGSLQRVSLVPDSMPAPLYQLPTPAYEPKWAVGDAFVAWASENEIWIGSTDGSAAAKQIYTATAGQKIKGLFADHERLYFAVRPEATGTPQFVGISLLEPYSAAPLLVDWFAFYAEQVKGPFAYGGCGSTVTWCRYDLRDGSHSILTGPQLPWETSSLHQDWLYAYTGAMGSDERLLGRFSLVSLGVQQELLGFRVTDLPSRQFATAVVGASLYLSSDNTIYALKLPPAPCQADLPCAAGTVCGPDQLCRAGQ